MRKGGAKVHHRALGRRHPGGAAQGPQLGTNTTVAKDEKECEKEALKFIIEPWAAGILAVPRKAPSWIDLFVTKLSLFAPGGRLW